MTPSLHKPCPPRPDGRSIPVLRRLLAVGLACPALVVGLAACGRSAPVDAIDEVDGDPDIAGVSITSPDAVVSTVSSIPGETVPVPISSEIITPTETVYTIEPGDTLSVIADRFDVSIDAIAAHNGITDINAIKPGEQLIIPTPPVDVTVVGEPATTVAGGG